jgi:formiminoglutamase
MKLANDPKWPRADKWFSTSAVKPLVTLLGIPAHKTSISPTSANLTPSAVREALHRYSTYHLGHDIDLNAFTALDAGDVDDPDWLEGELRVADKIHKLDLNDSLLLAVGGDNSITNSVMRAVFPDSVNQAGLITLDAHFDLRDGISNGSPVQRLISEAGLSGKNVVQIGINDFSNSAEYAARAREYGITVISRGKLRNRPISDVVAEALEVASAPAGIYLDVDVDVCDRSVVPACPAASPGGISADELRQFVSHFAADPRVKAIDFTEVDAAIDSPDGRTVRLVALCILEAAAARAKTIATI